MKKEDLELLGIQYLNSDLFKKQKEENIKELKIRKDFVERKFPKTKILSMTLEDFVIGAGSDNSFCYLLEFGMPHLGEIRGSFANSKYAIHYSKEIDDFSFSKGKFGSDRDTVFKNIKEQIFQLLEDAANDNIKSLKSSKLSPMFRRKIYFVYFPEKTLPFYNEEHINFFLNNMEIPYTTTSDYLGKIGLMMEWKNSSEVFKQFSNIDFMRFMYSSYAFAHEISVLKGKKEIKKIVDTNEVEFIEDKDVVDRIIQNNTRGHSKPDFNKINEKKTAAGHNAESFVLEYEKKHNKKFSRKIKVVGDDLYYGYDVLSYDSIGLEKHIEVKSCSSGSKEKIDFYITVHEKDNLEQDPFYVIYYVCGLSTKKPIIIALTKDNLQNTKFDPVVYKINGKIDC